MNIKQKIGAAVATAVMLGGLLVPSAFASTTGVNISRNGPFSYNKAILKSMSIHTVLQTNQQGVGVEVSSSSSTGGNKASGNVWGGGSVHTGTANSTTNVTVNGNTNVNNTGSCGCNTNTTNVGISHNGSFSFNKVVIEKTSSNIVTQENGSEVLLGVGSTSSTGGNNANGNVGGTSSVDTGTSNSTVNVTVTGNTNVVNP